MRPHMTAVAYGGPDPGSHGHADPPGTPNTLSCMARFEDAPRLGSVRRAGIMGGDEQVKFPPFPGDDLEASGPALPDLRSHCRVRARQGQRGPDRALSPGAPRCARPSAGVIGRWIRWYARRRPCERRLPALESTDGTIIASATPSAMATIGAGKRCTGALTNQPGLGSG